MNQADEWRELAGAMSRGGQTGTRKLEPVPGDLKAFCVLHDGARLWVPDPDYVVAECVDEEGGALLTAAQVEAMAPGDVLAVPDWSVSCHLVDAEWLENLPEHDGW